LFIVDGATGHTIVLELSSAKNKEAATVDRITEWSVGEQVVSAAPIYRKVSAAAGAPPRHELNLVARTATGVKRFSFDQARLSGPSNVGGDANGGAATTAPSASGSASPATAASAHTPGTNAADLVKRFGLDKTPSQAAPLGRELSSSFTTITSTTGGQTTTKSTVDPRMVTEVLTEQQRQFADVLRVLDASIVSLERLANERLGILRAGQAEAAALGEASARQTAAAIFANVAGNGLGGHDGEIPVNQEVLNGFTQSVTEAATITVQQALSAGLKQHVANSVDRAAAIVANNTEKEGLPTLKLAALPSMQALGEALDKAQAQQNELFRRQKEQDNAKYRNIIKSVQDKVLKTQQQAAQYLKELQGELSGLKGDLGSLGSAGPAAPHDAVESDEAVHQKALLLAEQGQWQQSLLKATGAGKTSVLLRFLETDFIKANRESLAEAMALSAPLFLTLLQQLSSELESNVGLIPVRTGWLHTFTLAFDEAAERRDSKLIEQLRASSVHIANVQDSIAAAEAHKTALDRTTQRQLKVVRKALEPFSM
jgi:hypothetical protein